MPPLTGRFHDDIKALQGTWRDKEGNEWVVSDYKARVSLVEGGHQHHIFRVLGPGRVSLLGTRTNGVEPGTITWEDGDVWNAVQSDYLKSRTNYRGADYAAQYPPSALKEIHGLQSTVREREVEIARLRQMMRQYESHGKPQPLPPAAAAATTTHRRVSPERPSASTTGKPHHTNSPRGRMGGMPSAVSPGMRQPLPGRGGRHGSPPHGHHLHHKLQQHQPVLPSRLPSEEAVGAALPRVDVDPDRGQRSAIPPPSYAPLKRREAAARQPSPPPRPVAMLAPGVPCVGMHGSGGVCPPGMRQPILPSRLPSEEGADLPRVEVDPNRGARSAIPPASYAKQQQQQHGGGGGGGGVGGVTGSATFVSARTSPALQPSRPASVQGDSDLEHTWGRGGDDAAPAHASGSDSSLMTPIERRRREMGMM